MIEIETGGRISGEIETEEEAKDSSPIVSLFKAGQDCDQDGAVREPIAEAAES